MNKQAALFERLLLMILTKYSVLIMQNRVYVIKLNAIKKATNYNEFTLRNCF